MRRTVGIGTLVVMAACAGTAGDEQAQRREVVVLRAEAGVLSVDPATGEVPLAPVDGVPSPDGRAVVRAEPVEDGRTRVTRLDTSTGEPGASRVVAGDLVPRVVSTGGELVALTPMSAAPRFDGYPAGRSRSRIVVVSMSTGATREHLLDGNVEPEAFSIDGDSLFVAQFSPADDPDRYRVRRLDLLSGRLGDVFSVDGVEQVDMRGAARTQAMSTDGTRLYTLYTTVDPNGLHPRAFVHVLGLDGEWAHCVDLQPSLATAAPGTALALTPDGRRLYLADPTSRTVAEIDTEALAVARTASLPGEFHLPMTAAATADRLLVAQVSTVLVLRLDDLLVENEVVLPGRVVGLHAEGSLFHAALDDRLVVVNATDGVVRREVRAPALTGVSSIGRATPLLDAGGGPLECAC